MMGYTSQVKWGEGWKSHGWEEGELHPSRCEGVIRKRKSDSSSGSGQDSKVLTSA